MNGIDIIQTSWLGGLTCGIIVSLWRIYKYIDCKYEKLMHFESDWNHYKEARENLLKKMVDPDKIQADFERSADIIEARNANRLTASRPDAGPAAKVWRPKVMRAKLPTRWNPPSDYDERLRGKYDS